MTFTQIMIGLILSGIFILFAEINLRKKRGNKPLNTRNPLVPKKWHEDSIKARER